MMSQNTQPNFQYQIDIQFYMSQRLKQINKAIQKESRIIQLRNQSKLNKEELINSIFPQKMSKHFDAVYQVIRNNPAIFQHGDIEELSRAEERGLGVKQALKLMTSLNINMQTDPFKYLAATYIYSFFGFGQSTKGFVHYILYMKTLLLFKMNSYHQKQLERAKKLLDLGSFSLTEMHHGSFSRGIGTEARYDHTTKQFVINTFGQKGMKFWIGNTAQTATKTILWAQLIVNNVNYGPHPFVMQLRDYNTHEVLKGIIIGDCGPKIGANIIDNGYIIIKDFRIPSQALLGKLGYVDESGQYVSKIQTNEQRFGLHMSPLSSGRASLSLSVLTQSIAALTIAIRFVCQRRQFKVNQNEEQVLLIDYPLTRFRLMVPLATTIVYYFASCNINKFYIDNVDNFTDPGKKIISELHAISAVLKAKGTWFANSTITQCREMLGGHGYSSFSGLGRYYNDNDVNITWQGDNNLLLQQTSKYLLKALKSKEKGSVLNLQFVHQGLQSIEPTQQTLNSLSQLRVLLQTIFIHRYNTAVKQLTRVRNQLTKKSIEPQNLEAEIWNRVQPYFCNQMSLAYGDLFYFNEIYKVLLSYKGTQANKNFLSVCLKVWAQNVLLKNSFNSLQTRKTLQKLIIEGCQLIYPDSIIATDALAPPSYVLGSPFAQEDGEGMKAYLNLLFSGKKTFGRVPWFQKLIKLREQN